MSSTQNPYKHTSYSFMVRLWQEALTWRALVQSVQTGETICFADLESLFTFLEAQTVPCLGHGEHKARVNLSVQQENDLSA